MSKEKVLDASGLGPGKSFAIELPPTARNRDEELFDQGWLMAAKWTKRDDLHADMDAPSYIEQRAQRIAQVSTSQGLDATVEAIDLRFRSGNSTQIDKAWVPTAEWNALKSALLSAAPYLRGQSVPDGMVLTPRAILESIRDSSTDSSARDFAAGALANAPKLTEGREDGR